jgi:hypothetical protein
MHTGLQAKSCFKAPNRVISFYIVKTSVADPDRRGSAAFGRITNVDKLKSFEGVYTLSVNIFRDLLTYRSMWHKKFLSLRKLHT